MVMICGGLPATGEAQLMPSPCLPVISSNIPLTWWIPGKGDFYLRFMAPNTSIPGPLISNYAVYSPSSIEVTGPGSSPWAAIGTWLGSCWQAGPLLIARAEMFNGVVRKAPRPEEYDGVCNEEPEIRGFDAADVTPHLEYEDPDCEDGWAGTPPGGGGGGGGSTTVCYEITYYWIYEDGYVEEIGSDTYCFEVAAS